jgi:acyl carrier protein
MNPDIIDRVIQFVSERVGVNRERLTLETTLFGDLGIDGNDGRDLVNAFGSRFGVDLSGFDPSKHFGPEAGCFPPTAIYQLVREYVFGDDAHELAGVVPISIRELVEAAETKRWAARG